MDWKKPINRAPAIRLTSTAGYTRPPLAAHTDPPINSTYRSTMCVASADEMHRRCVESRRSVKSSRMVHEASLHIPVGLVDEIKAAVDEEYSDMTATKRASSLAVTASQAARMAPAATPAEAALGQVIMSEPRRGICSKIVQDDFAGGGLDGPFPGSRSAYGKHCSEIFWQLNKGAAGGRLATVKMSRIAPNGTRLKNWNMMP
jgi:hypothetical protein